MGILIDPTTAPAQPTPAAGALVFQDPGPLIDRELELVEPAGRWVDAMLESLAHPLTLRGDPEQAALSRDFLLEMIDRFPNGHEPPDPARGRVGAYHFWMRLRWDPSRGPGSVPPVPMAGHINLRLGNTYDIVRHFGHLGYTVYAPARGRHYAERSCRLLLPLARAHGLTPLWVTTDPANAPSRRTCERLGGRLVEVVPIPADHALYRRGQRWKCRYRVDL
jgi:tagatose 1,6-diphosphate aldolase